MKTKNSSKHDCGRIGHIHWNDEDGNRKTERKEASKRKKKRIRPPPSLFTWYTILSFLSIPFHFGSITPSIHLCTIPPLPLSPLPPPLSIQRIQPRRRDGILHRRRDHLPKLGRPAVRRGDVAGGGRFCVWVVGIGRMWVSQREGGAGVRGGDSPSNRSVGRSIAAHTHTCTCTQSNNQPTKAAPTPHPPGLGLAEPAPVLRMDLAEPPPEEAPARLAAAAVGGGGALVGYGQSVGYAFMHLFIRVRVCGTCVRHCLSPKSVIHLSKQIPEEVVQPLDDAALGGTPAGNVAVALLCGCSAFYYACVDQSRYTQMK